MEWIFVSVEKQLHDLPDVVSRWSLLKAVEIGRLNISSWCELYLA